jgi:4-hydroxybenzoate polyprenyltransferase
MSNDKNAVLFYISFILAVLFLIYGLVWVYFFALIFAYPLGLVSFIIWRKIKSDNKKRNSSISAVLIAGVVLSMLSLIITLIAN